MNFGTVRSEWPTEIQINKNYTGKATIEEYLATLFEASAQTNGAGLGGTKQQVA